MDTKSKHDKTIKTLEGKLTDLEKEYQEIGARKAEQASAAADAILAGVSSAKSESEIARLDGRALSLKSAIEKTRANLADAQKARFEELQQAAQAEFLERYGVLFEEVIQSFVNLIDVNLGAVRWSKEARALEALAMNYKLGDRLIGQARNIIYQMPADPLRAMIENYAASATGNPAWKEAKRRANVR